MKKAKEKGSGGRRSIIERLVTERDVPAELLWGGCYIEIRGRSCVVIRGCRRILEYSEGRVALSLKRTAVLVTGKRLTCISYLAGAVSVEGIIDSVSFLGKEGGAL